jgi:hypothetical protein
MGAMEEDVDGNYVRWEDYETAEQQRDEARELLQEGLTTASWLSWTVRVMKFLAPPAAK